MDIEGDAKNSLSGFYLGPELSVSSDQHTISSQGIHRKKKSDSKKVNIHIGYGKMVSEQLYLGAELTLPIKSDLIKTKKTALMLGGVRQNVEHEIKKHFPIDLTLKLGFPIDERVMLYGKVGFTHYRLTHKISSLGHSDTTTITFPVFGAGVAFHVNGKWVMKGEFVSTTAPKNKNSLFSHENKHQGIKFGVGYRF